MNQPSPPCTFYVNISGETQQIDKNSSTIPIDEFSSFVEFSLDACCLFQQSFLRWSYFPQNQHFPLPLLSFDLDMVVPFLSFPLSIDRPMTTIAYVVEVSLLDVFLIYLDNKAPVTVS
jgi:hypothetical protein